MDAEEPQKPWYRLGWTEMPSWATKPLPWARNRTDRTRRRMKIGVVVVASVLAIVLRDPLVLLIAAPAVLVSSVESEVRRKWPQSDAE